MRHHRVAVLAAALATSAAAAPAASAFQVQPTVAGNATPAAALAPHQTGGSPDLGSLGLGVAGGALVLVVGAGIARQRREGTDPVEAVRISVGRR